ncbi:MAG: anaerobic ribonucleoside-triphosphate reductase [Clostridia bacterium]
MTQELTPEQQICLDIFDNESIEVYKYNGVHFKTNNTDMRDEIKQQYIEYYSQKVAPQKLKNLIVNDDGVSEFVDTHYDTVQVPFNRIRRITGYLVGDVSRWNTGKRAEERDRVHHTGV